MFDDDADEADAIDVEPASGLDYSDPLAGLVKRAEQLITARDPKPDATIKELKPLIAAGAVRHAQLIAENTYKVDI